MIDYTIFYVVGGNNVYYQQLKKSLRSLKRIKTPHKVKVLDLNRKLKSYDNIEVIYTDDNITTKEMFWKYKFYLCQQLDTKYGIYLDSDTIVCCDRLDEISNKLGNKFGVVHHFHVKNFANYKRLFYHPDAFKFTDRYNLTGDDKFYTGGVFMFHNNIKNMNILKSIFNIHDEYNLNIRCGIYDETFISLMMSKQEHIIFNGSFNHCSMDFMPLKIQDNVLMGKNPFDIEFEPVFVLHGTTKRQLEGLDFEGEIKEKVKNLWNV